MAFTSETIRDLVEQKIAFVKRMGLKVVDLRPGYVKLMAPLKGNENHVGNMYAGAMFTLADIMGGALILASFDPSKYFPLLKDLTMQFRRPAGSDISIEVSLSQEEIQRINGELTANGKADFTLHGNLTDVSGTVVAESRGLYHVRLADTSWTLKDG